MFRKIFPWIALLLLVVSDSSMALGLGDIKLKSALNQPFNAEIQLISADSLAKSQIVINLASQEEFSRAGVEHYFFLRSLKFVPVFKDDGSVFVKVTSKEAIKEPFLNFLIEVNWPNGRMIREYTVLLDPPAFTEVELTSAPEAAVSTSNNNYQPKRVETNTIAEDNWSDNDRYSDNSSDSSDDGSSVDDYQVKDADTLWGIARKNKLQNTSIQQTMVAIFNANPSAFSNNNMNQLKRGAVLEIASASQSGLSQQQALLEIARQNQLWGGRGNAGTRPDAVIDTADYASTSSGGTDSEPRLRLAAVGEGDTGGSSSALESEAVTTLSVENQSLRSRVDSQAERIEKLERLLELQSNELAAASDNAATSNEVNADPNSAAELTQTEAGDVAGSTEVATLDEDSLTAAEDTAANTSEISDDPLSAIADDLNNAGQQSAEEEQTSEVETAVTENDTATEPTKVDNINTAPAMVTKDESFLDSITNFTSSLGTTVWLAIGSGIFIIFFSFLYIRRKNMEDEDFQDSLVVPVTEDFEDEMPVVGDEILAAEMGVDHDYIPESELENFDDDAVDTETNADPLGEADVYLAYGKFDQAERILRDALEEEPDRLDLRLKIMECFAETKSLSEFKDQKREILDVLATDETVAEQVNIMERQAWPEEQQQDDSLPSTEDIFGDLSFGNDEQSSDDLSFPDEKDTNDSVEVNNDDLDSALDMSTAAASDESRNSEQSDSLTSDEFIDADIDLESDGLDFNSAADEESLNDDSVDGNHQAASEDVDFISESELMDSEMDDDLSTDEEEEPIDESILDLGDVDEASTKLDLARAYIDMEDFDGASEILQEVLTEGSDSQKTEAEELLDKMK